MSDEGGDITEESEAWEGGDVVMGLEALGERLDRLARGTLMMGERLKTLEAICDDNADKVDALLRDLRERVRNLEQREREREGAEGIL